MWNIGYVNAEDTVANMATGVATTSWFQQIWDCSNTESSGVYTSACTMKMGDSVLDWELGERCEPNMRPIEALDATGWTFPSY